MAEFIEAGYALSPDERLEAARMLSLSVEHDTNGDQADIDAAWDDLIDRRVEEISSGKVEPIDGREGLARIRAELAARRR
ncbi:MAG: addiction module protein [Microlunatus sp.]